MGVRTVCLHRSTYRTGQDAVEVTRPGARGVVVPDAFPRTESTCISWNHPAWEEEKTARKDEPTAVDSSTPSHVHGHGA